VIGIRCVGDDLGVFYESYDNFTIEKIKNSYFMQQATLVYDELVRREAKNCL
jgi:hypothetical protein